MPKRKLRFTPSTAQELHEAIRLPPKQRLNQFGPANTWDVSNVTDMTRMFEGTDFNEDISDWDVSNVTIMRDMFRSSKFTKNISNWDVSSVENMNSMFMGSLFNGDIRGWDVSNVTSMVGMFHSSQFNQDIRNWDVSNVEDMSMLFSRSHFTGDISSWEVSNVADMSFMFSYSRFNGDISRWNVSNVMNMTGMFEGSAFSHTLDEWIPRLRVDVRTERMFAESILSETNPYYSLVPHQTNENPSDLKTTNADTLEAFDYITLENVNVKKWLETDSHHIIFYLPDGQIIASSRAYFENISNLSIVVKAEIVNNVIDYSRTLRSPAYLNLLSFGMGDYVTPLDPFLHRIFRPENREIKLVSTNETFLGEKLLSFEHNSHSYPLVYKNGPYGYKIQQHAALNKYTYHWDRAINAYLRSSQPDNVYLQNAEFLKYHKEFGPAPKYALAAIKKMIDRIDNAFIDEGRISTSAFIVFRGTTNCVLYDGVNLGFLSTSTDRDVAEDFADGGCIYHIQVEPGIPYLYIENVSNSPHEFEILLPRNLKTTLINKQGKTYYVKLEPTAADQFVLKDPSKLLRKYTVVSLEQSVGGRSKTRGRQSKTRGRQSKGRRYRANKRCTRR